jgi:hypothetical protein
MLLGGNWSQPHACPALGVNSAVAPLPVYQHASAARRVERPTHFDLVQSFLRSAVARHDTYPNLAGFDGGSDRSLVLLLFASLRFSSMRAITSSTVVRGTSNSAPIASWVRPSRCIDYPGVGHVSDVQLSGYGVHDQKLL